jgi:hypothetical protein
MGIYMERWSALAESVNWLPLSKGQLYARKPTFDDMSREIKKNLIHIYFGLIEYSLLRNGAYLLSDVISYFVKQTS